MSELARKILESTGVKKEDASAAPAPAGGGVHAANPTETQNPELPVATTTPVAAPAQPAAPAAAAQPANSSIAPDVEDIEDGRLLAMLNKKLGKDYKTLDEVTAAATAPAAAQPLTADEQQKQAEQFRNDALQFGLKHKLFDSKTLESFAVDKGKDSRDIAFAAFAAGQKEAEPNLSQQEINERFQEYYFELEDENDWRRVARRKEMDTFAQAQLNGQYGSVLSIEDQYKNYIAVEKKAEQYAGIVDGVVSGLNKDLSFDVDGQAYTFTVSDKSITEIKENLLGADAFARIGQDATKESIGLVMQNALTSKHLQEIVGQVAKAYATDEILKAKMGRQGVVPERESGAGQSQPKVPYTGAAKSILENNKPKSKIPQPA